MGLSGAVGRCDYHSYFPKSSSQMFNLIPLSEEPWFTRMSPSLPNSVSQMIIGLPRHIHIPGHGFDVSVTSVTGPDQRFMKSPLPQGHCTKTFENALLPQQNPRAVLEPSRPSPFAERVAVRSLASFHHCHTRQSQHDHVA